MTAKASRRAAIPPALEASEETERISREIDRITFGAGRLEEPGWTLFPLRPLAFHRIVAAVDGTPASAHVVPWAAELAHAFEGDVWLTHVTAPAATVAFYGEMYGSLPLADEIEAAQRRGSAILDGAAQRMRRLGTEPEVVHASGAPVAEIARLASATAADLVVVGAGRHNLVERALLGSISGGVKDHAAASVLVARNDPPPERLIAPVDGSGASKRAAAIAVRLARRWGASTTMMHVLRQAPADLDPDGTRDIRRRAVAPDVSWDDSRVGFQLRFGDPAGRVLEEAAKQDAGLVVMGSRGLGGLRSLVAGSVSNRVVTAATTSVLLVKEVTA